MHGESSEWVTEFHGVVHPGSQCWHLDEPFELTFPNSAWVLTVADSKFRVLVKGGPRDDLATFRNEVMSILSGVLDSIGFHLGAVLRPELYGFTVIAPDRGGVILGSAAHVWCELVKRDPAVPLRAGSAELGRFMRSAATNPLIRHALADLSLAIDRPDDTAFYAYRAVESARQFFREDCDPEDAEVPWSRLHEALGYTKEELRPLARAAKARRHGDARSIDEQERLTVLQLAREVLGRLVDLHEGRDRNS